MVRIGYLGFVGVLFMVPLACSSGDDGAPDDTGTVASPSQEAKCGQAEAKDTLIADLVHMSVMENYPLTRLYEDVTGEITGPGLPASIEGQLQILNTVPAARDSVATALEKVTGLPDYSIDAYGLHAEACDGVPAWTPLGDVMISTNAYWVEANPTNYDSWRTAHKEFGKQCPLVKRVGNDDIYDPPGDGSTNAPPSSTVSSWGVVANAWGICPSGAWQGTYCKLSYATGVNWTGRWCRYYYGANRCVLK